MKVSISALKHGISEADILYAAAHPVFLSEPDDAMPAKQFALGFDTHGRPGTGHSDLRLRQPLDHPCHEGPPALQSILGVTPPICSIRMLGSVRAVGRSRSSHVNRPLSQPSRSRLSADHRCTALVGGTCVAHRQPQSGHRRVHLHPSRPYPVQFSNGTGEGSLAASNRTGEVAVAVAEEDSRPGPPHPFRLPYH